MLNKWNELTKKDQNLILILISAMMIGVYIGAVYLTLGSDVFEAQKLVSRKENRLSLKNKKMGEIKDPSVYEKKIAAIQPELTEITEKYNRIKNGFVPLDELDKVESLRLEISEYARASSIAIRSMNTVGGRDINSTEAPDSESKKQIVRNLFKRMLIDIESYTTFSSLLKFLDGMDELSYYAAVVQINIKAISPDLEVGELEKSSTKKLIKVDMIIAI